MDQKVSNISGVNINTDALLEEMLTAELITTAVGLAVLPRIAPVIASGIRLRRGKGLTAPLNIIACENGIRASSQLKGYVLQYLNEEEAAYVEQYVGFPDCSVDRIVPPVKTENITDVVVESFFEWNVEAKSFRGAVPHIGGMNLADNLIAYIERKLFTLNTGHAITGYLGFLKGYATIDQSICDPAIYRVVRQAMRESGLGLIKKYGFDQQSHFKYIDKIIGRLKNPKLKDELSRVCREPLRKLSPDDRLVRPLLLAREYGLGAENLVLGIGAALHYQNEQDPQSVELQCMIREKGMEGAVSHVTGIVDPHLLGEIRQAYTEIKTKLK
ncbi:MAG: mannitol-1-phosphate 5-dehydrogenase [Prolixibacteraceae bacterium]|jgi:mannitol-1-phosphate 5-dehydrogenase|nr:mannitol-1-phosphate 5-dehydrogenase [Prolixibacteraceae bacterium]